MSTDRRTAADRGGSSARRATPGERPRVFRSISAMRRWSEDARRKRHTIGFVPTMGALHEGHLALVRAARRRCDVVAVSVFVNPTQFGPGEDFERYPRDLRRDRSLCREAGADVIFAPSVRAMYRQASWTRVSVPDLQETLCGASRPGHFDGVCLVVAKLLNIVRPDELYLGQKDAQQAVVLSRMVEDLDFGVRVRVVPTVRERDGLALSSRNAYLDAAGRAYAVRLYEALELGRSLIESGERDASVVTGRMREHLTGPEGRIDYVEIVDRSTLRAVSTVDRDVLLAVAVWVGKARLIDNIPLSAERTRRGGERRREKSGHRQGKGSSG